MANLPLWKAKLLNRAHELENEARIMRENDQSGHLECCGNNMANWMDALAADLREIADVQH